MKKNQINYLSFNLLDKKVKSLINNEIRKNLYDTISYSPDYITGFIDGEGCFTVRIQRQLDTNLKYRIRVAFEISQEASSSHVIYAIKNYFNCGYITYYARPKKELDNLKLIAGTTKQFKDDKDFFLLSDKDYFKYVKFETKNTKDIYEQIIPHFKKYHLKTTKLLNFIIFNEIIEKIYKKEHLTIKGFLECVDLAYSMNKKEFKRNKKRREVYEDFAKLNNLSVNFLEDEGIV